MKNRVCGIRIVVACNVLFISYDDWWFSELETLYDKVIYNQSPITKTMDVTKEFTDIKNLEIQE
ncbi:MAG: hypothetical protein ACLRQF_17170 [Thomasclavelia ramosa]